MGRLRDGLPHAHHTMDTILFIVRSGAEIIDGDGQVLAREGQLVEVDFGDPATRGLMHRQDHKLVQVERGASEGQEVLQLGSHRAAKPVENRALMAGDYIDRDLGDGF